MAELPDPRQTLGEDDRARLEAVMRQRHETEPAEVYLRMFNNPDVAALVGDLGAHLRYHGVLPDDVRELVILHLARRMGLAYEWAHHVRFARAAGITDTTVAALAAEKKPSGLRDEQVAALAAADATHELRSIPASVQRVLDDAYGAKGVVELVAVVGLYRLIGGVIAAFDVRLEPRFDPPAWG
ncbi:MAG TPA: carboxymuconolactone decarboxylase family protein [Acidimicrobiia bacterium]